MKETLALALPWPDSNASDAATRSWCTTEPDAAAPEIPKDGWESSVSGRLDAKRVDSGETTCAEAADTT